MCGTLQTGSWEAHQLAAVADDCVMVNRQGGFPFVGQCGQGLAGRGAVFLATKSRSQDAKIMPCALCCQGYISSNVDTVEGKGKTHDEHPQSLQTLPSSLIAPDPC